MVKRITNDERDPDYRYGRWAGNEKGVAQNPQRCVAEVWWPRYPYPTQCSRKRGHGPQGLWCKQHFHTRYMKMQRT